MTHTDNNIYAQKVAQLKDLLHLIARDPSLDVVAPAILSEARIVARAAAGFYVVFGEPHAVFTVGIEEQAVPDVMELRAQVAQIDDSILLSTDVPAHLSDTYPGWLLIPVRYKQRPAAALGLLSEGELNLDDASLDLIITLIDGLSIVTHSAKVNARHQKLMQNQNEFVRIVSHDLRSPLTSVQGFASMLESQMVGPLTEKQQHFVEKILAGVSQMTSLVDNIQDAGRYDPETGFYEMERSPVDLIDVVQRIANNHLMPAEKQELTLSVKADSNVPIVNVDSNMLERSITNLVDNAIKYTPNGGRIEVGVNREGDDIVITVRDNGYGISPENKRMLFQRHFRIRRREHKRVKGSGLGLFIVRSVAQQHDGDAFVESEEGEGSIFGIRIPLRGANLLGDRDSSSTRNA